MIERPNQGILQVCWLSQLISCAAGESGLLCWRITVCVVRQVTIHEPVHYADLGLCIVVNEQVL